MAGGVQREPALARVFERMGPKALARRLGRSPGSVGKWRRVPRDLVEPVARLTGLAAEDIRPDLADWLDRERLRRAMEKARERWGSAETRATIRRMGRAPDDEPSAGSMRLVDLGVTVAALRFAAAEAGLAPRTLWTAPFGAGGLPTPEQRARAHGMALAVIAGVECTVVAQVIGTTKQNVQGVTQRYLRQRDGDGEDAEGGRVIERGRVRLAKAADPDLWAAERRFLEELAR